MHTLILTLQLYPLVVILNRLFLQTLSSFTAKFTTQDLSCKGDCHTQRNQGDGEGQDSVIW